MESWVNINEVHVDGGRYTLCAYDMKNALNSLTQYSILIPHSHSEEYNRNTKYYIYDTFDPIHQHPHPNNSVDSLIHSIFDDDRYSRQALESCGSVINLQICSQEEINAIAQYKSQLQSRKLEEVLLYADKLWENYIAEKEILAFQKVKLSVDFYILIRKNGNL